MWVFPRCFLMFVPLLRALGVLGVFLNKPSLTMDPLMDKDTEVRHLSPEYNLQAKLEELAVFFCC